LVIENGLGCGSTGGLLRQDSEPRAVEGAGAEKADAADCPGASATALAGIRAGPIPDSRNEIASKDLITVSELNVFMQIMENSFVFFSSNAG